MDGVGSRIRDFREQRGLTIEDLAKTASMRPQFLLSIEEGDVLRVNTFTVQKLADHLGVTLGMLLGEEGLPDPDRSVFDEVSDEYRWIIWLTMWSIIVLGGLVLTLTIIAAGSTLILWLISLS